jgi:hypothetical protein
MLMFVLRVMVHLHLISILTNSRGVGINNYHLNTKGVATWIHLIWIIQIEQNTKTTYQ